MRKATFFDQRKARMSHADYHAELTKTANKGLSELESDHDWTTEDIKNFPKRVVSILAEAIADKWIAERIYHESDPDYQPERDEAWDDQSDLAKSVARAVLFNHLLSAN